MTALCRALAMPQEMSPAQAGGEEMPALPETVLTDLWVPSEPEEPEAMPETSGQPEQQVQPTQEVLQDGTPHQG